MKRLHLTRLFARMPLVILIIAVTAAASGFFAVQAIAARGSSASQSCDVAVCVALTEQGMDPDTITLKKGEFVQFNAADGKTHNLAFGSGADSAAHHDSAESGAPHEHAGDTVSGDFESDEAWRAQFNQVGTYRLHDHYNPELEIIVVVYDPASDTTIRVE